MSPFYLLCVALRQCSWHSFKLRLTHSQFFNDGVRLVLNAISTSVFTASDNLKPELKREDGGR